VKFKCVIGKHQDILLYNNIMKTALEINLFEVEYINCILMFCNAVDLI